MIGLGSDKKDTIRDGVALLYTLLALFTLSTIDTVLLLYTAQTVACMPHVYIEREG